MALLWPVFLSGLSDYSHIPRGYIREPTPGMKLGGSENIRGAEQEAVCKEDVVTGSEVFPGKGPVSQLFIHSFVCVLAELASAAEPTWIFVLHQCLRLLNSQSWFLFVSDDRICNYPQHIRRLSPYCCLCIIKIALERHMFNSPTWRVR